MAHSADAQPFVLADCLRQPLNSRTRKGDRFIYHSSVRFWPVVTCHLPLESDKSYRSMAFIKSRVDDKTKRDGFADYICSVASDHGVTPDLVKVIDIVKLVRTGKFIELGRANCSCS